MYQHMTFRNFRKVEDQILSKNLVVNVSDMTQCHAALLFDGS